MALSCKRFLSCYKVVAKDSSMLPPQPTENHLPLSYVNSQDKLRVRLLVRLENLQWAYCAECLSLKSRKLFTPDALNASALERHCSRYDGVIQLCPCLHLTSRDRNNVRLLLRSPVTPRGEFRYGISALNVTGGDLLAIPVHYFQAKIERCEPARKLLSPIWLLGFASLVYSDSILWWLFHRSCCASVRMSSPRSDTSNSHGWRLYQMLQMLYYCLARTRNAGGPYFSSFLCGSVSWMVRSVTRSVLLASLLCWY